MKTDTDAESTHWADCWRAHHTCAAVRIANLSRRVRIQQSALQVIVEFTHDPKATHLALKALDDTRW